MALVNPNIAMSVKPLEVQFRNPMAEAAQLMNLQQAQMQMEKLRQTDEAIERIRQAAVKNGGPGDLNEIAQAFLLSPDLGHQQLGLKIREQQREKQEFETMGRKLYPQLFGAGPTAAPAAAPMAPAQPGALGSGTFDITPAPATNALAPAPANQLTPAAPAAAPAVNALAAPGAAQQLSPSGKTRQELEGLIFMAQMNPKFKGMAETAKLELAEMMKTPADVATMNALNIPITEAGFTKFQRLKENPGEFARTLDRLNLAPEQRRVLEMQYAQKLATHAPGTTVNVSTEKSYGSRFGGLLAERDAAKLDTAEKATDLADSANRIIGLVQQGNVFTGPAADIKLNIARVLNVAGANNQEKIANTESLIAATGQSTLNAIKGAGLGTGQGFTDKDLRFLQGVAGGTIGLTQQTLTELARLQHQTAVKSAERWNKRVKELSPEVIKGASLSTEPIVVPPLAFPNIKKQPSVVQTPAPAGLDPALWSVMTPQERALWQK